MNKKLSLYESYISCLDLEYVFESKVEAMQRLSTVELFCGLEDATTLCFVSKVK